MTLIAELEIIGLPKTINAIGRKHWSVKVKEAKHWKERVMIACVLSKIKDLGLKTATLELTRYSSKEPDFDNLASSFKHVLDGLVYAGVILDDKPSVIGSPTFIWKKTDNKAGKVTIKIFTD